jgi:hypothetical protein
MIEGQHFQNGYVTRDIDQAMGLLQAKCGLHRVASFEVPVEVSTPYGCGIAVSRLAFIWVNNLQIELIQPVSGLVDIYTERLPSGAGIGLHHVCMRIADWDDFRARAEQGAFPVVLEGGSDVLKFLYLDARDVLGHYLEYVWMTPERWLAMGGPAGR